MRSINAFMSQMIWGCALIFSAGYICRAANVPVVNHITTVERLNQCIKIDESSGNLDLVSVVITYLLFPQILQLDSMKIVYYDYGKTAGFEQWNQLYIFGNVRTVNDVLSKLEWRAWGVGVYDKFILNDYEIQATNMMEVNSQNNAITTYKLHDVVKRLLCPTNQTPLKTDFSFHIRDNMEIDIPVYYYAPDIQRNITCNLLMQDTTKRVPSFVKLLDAKKKILVRIMEDKNVIDSYFIKNDANGEYILLMRLEIEMPYNKTWFDFRVRIFNNKPILSTGQTNLHPVICFNQNFTVPLQDNFLTDIDPKDLHFLEIKPQIDYSNVENQWLQFDEIEKVFYGIPDPNKLTVGPPITVQLPNWLGINIGTEQHKYTKTVPIKYTDGWSTAQTSITFDIINHAPIVFCPLLYEIQGTDTDLFVHYKSTYYLTIAPQAFFDKEQDQLILEAKFKNGSALPDWLQFVSLKKKFIIKPTEEALYCCQAL